MLKLLFEGDRDPRVFQLLPDGPIEIHEVESALLLPGKRCELTLFDHPPQIEHVPQSAYSTLRGLETTAAIVRTTTHTDSYVVATE